MNRLLPLSAGLFVALCASTTWATEDQPPEPVRRTVAQPAPAPSQPAAVAPEQQQPKHRDAQTLLEDGTYLPGTYAARIGDQRISAFTLGGYDSNANQGGVFSGVIEGAIVNRIAIRVGYDYLQSQGSGNVTAGLRFGVLRQEQHGVDLGFLVQYKQKGF